MDADVVIGERCMEWFALEGWHVAADAAIGRVDRAGRAVRGEIGPRVGGWGMGLPLGSGSAGVTAQAWGVGMGLGRLGVVMGVVAGRAVQRTGALGVATTPGQRRPLEADPEWIGARQRQFL